jgi:hypothetical protein
MLDPVVMWVLGAGIVLLPFVVTYTMNGRNQSDSRGRRVSRRWTGRSLLPKHGARRQ